MSALSDYQKGKLNGALHISSVHEGMTVRFDGFEAVITEIGKKKIPDMFARSGRIRRSLTDFTREKLLSKVRDAERQTVCFGPDPEQKIRIKEKHKMEKMKMLADEELEQISGGYSTVDRDMYPHLVVTTKNAWGYRALPPIDKEKLTELSAGTQLLASDEVVPCFAPYYTDYNYVKCAVRMSSFEYGYINTAEVKDTGRVVNKK